MREALCAFGFINSKLYIASSHYWVLENAVNDGAAANGGIFPSTSVFGWIWKEDDGSEEAEVWSDTLNQPRHDDAQMNKTFEILKKRFPNLTSITFGPDTETIKDMKEFFNGS